MSEAPPVVIKQEKPDEYPEISVSQNNEVEDLKYPHNVEFVSVAVKVEVEIEKAPDVTEVPVETVDIKIEPVFEDNIKSEQHEEYNEGGESNNHLKDETEQHMDNEQNYIEHNRELNNVSGLGLIQQKFVFKNNTYEPIQSAADINTPLNEKYYVMMRDKYCCLKCKRMFTTKETLDKHVSIHTVDKSERFKCNFCGKFCSSYCSLCDHIRTHTGEKPFKCDICLRDFTVKHNLIKHQRTARCKKKVDYVCPECNKVFDKEILYKSHMHSHSPEKPYTCDTCHMQFKYRSTIVRHVRTHSGQRPFACPICKKTFTHAGLVKPHMRSHTGERPFQCPICPKTFSLKHNAKKHVVFVHRREKILTCWICQKTFPRESRLKYHMQRHTKAKPFGCDICKRVFSHKQNVLRHIKRKHPSSIKQ